MSFLDPQIYIRAGYVAIFLVIFAESGLLIGFFLPGDSLLPWAPRIAAGVSILVRLGPSLAQLLRA